MFNILLSELLRGQVGGWGWAQELDIRLGSVERQVEIKYISFTRHKPGQTELWSYDTECTLWWPVTIWAWRKRVWRVLKSPENGTLPVVSGDYNHRISLTSWLPRTGPGWLHCSQWTVIVTSVAGTTVASFAASQPLPCGWAQVAASTKEGNEGGWIQLKHIKHIYMYETK